MSIYLWSHWPHRYRSRDSRNNRHKTELNHLYRNGVCNCFFISFLLLFTLQHYKYIIMPICRHRRRHSSVSVASFNSIVDCSVCLLTIFISTIYSVGNTETILFVFSLRRQGRLQLQWKHIIFGRPIGRWSLGEKFNGTEI